MTGSTDVPVSAGTSNPFPPAPAQATGRRASAAMPPPPPWPAYQSHAPAAVPGPTYSTQPVWAAPPVSIQAPAARPARRSRTADAALLMAAFVATAGLAFAVGRLSMPTSPASPGTTFLAMRAPGVDLQAPAAAATEDGGTAQTASAVTEGSAPGFVGLGPGGLQGTVTNIETGGLTLEMDDGSSQTVATDDSTTYVRQAPVDASDLKVGDTVRVQLSFTGPMDQAATADATPVAGQVTIMAEAGV